MSQSDRAANVDRLPDAETLAEWGLAMVAALPIAALLGGLLGAGFRGLVRWTGFLLVVAAPVTYALVVGRFYRRIGVFPEEFRRAIAFLGLAWVLGTALLAATALLGGVVTLSGTGHLVVAIAGIAATLLLSRSIASAADHREARSTVLRSVAVQLVVVLVVGAPGSPVSSVVGWVGIAAAPVLGDWWRRLGAG